MAIKPVVGYTGSGWSYPSAAKPGKTALYKPPPIPGTTGGGLSYTSTPLDQDGQRVGVGTVGGGKVSTGGGGGSTPLTTTTTRTPLQVYQDEILGDPGSVAAQGQYDTTLSQLANARKDAIQRAIFGAGWNPSAIPGGIPASLQDYTSDFTGIDPGSNPLSTKAQLDKQLSQANYSLPYQLAATGMGRSGAYAVNASNLQNQYDTASYGGMQDLLSSILGAGQNYASGVSSAASQLDAARAAVAQRLQQMAGYSETTTTSGGDGGGDTGFVDSAPGGGSMGGTPVSLSNWAGAVTGNPSNPLHTTIQKAIKSIGIKKKPANIYQIGRNMMAG